jgi:hypothetical protein
LVVVDSVLVRVVDFVDLIFPLFDRVLDIASGLAAPTAVVAASGAVAVLPAVTALFLVTTGVCSA